MKRPTGVLVIGILAIIGGVLGIIFSIGVFGAGTIVAGLSVGVGGGIIVVAVIYLILAIVQLLMGIAFLSLKQWAWWGLIILLAANIVWAIVMMASWAYGTTSLFGIIVDVALIWYLNTKGIKGAFFATGAPDLLSKVSGGKFHDDQVMKGH